MSTAQKTIISAAPYIHSGTTVTGIMQRTIYALIPGILLSAFYWGTEIIVSCILAVIFALIFEATVLKIRQQDIVPKLKDGSAVVTAVLFALTIPPYTAWWIILSGIVFAIVIAKHLYGGIGRNPFNPAMTGCAFVLLCFPTETTLWPAPNSSDAYRFGAGQNTGWVWIAGTWLAGGLWLIVCKIIRWHIPAAVLGGLFAMSLFFYVIVPNMNFSPAYHLINGGAVLCAFFIATDPASSPTTSLGKILYGMGIGFLIYLICTWGAPPNSIAFSILIMNTLAPLIDHYTQPTLPKGKI